ncbi:MAG: DNA-directed RNA polymerase subunit beta' [Candidatus Omnitrophota bacterium]|nr:MAG: DNA-directed RNA polymerase subunit beta' [Candidatus Omnitrophota bacterium]
MAVDANAFDAISIKIASAEVIRQWSKGEVKKPETINYRTLKPEKDGLFCERIFGPTKDWECNCGKYKRIKYKGIICDRCGVEITLSKVRRERMGHIELATPVTHVWFFKALPSRMGAILNLSQRELEKIIYYEEYVVLDPGDTPLHKMELLTEDRYQEYISRYGSKFKAMMGAEAIRTLLKEIDLNKLSKTTHKDLLTAKTETNRKKFIKVLKVVNAFKKSGNKAEWMVLDAVPVIPPDLRPLVPLEGGRFATSDLNDLYRRVINRNNRLKKLIELNAPDVIVRNEKRMLQEAVDALFDNGRHGHPVLGPGNRPLKSLSDMLKGKQGRFRQNLLGKRVDYSGRSVIVVGPELKLHQCGLPKRMALELFEPFIIKELRARGLVHTVKSAKRMVERARLEVWDILEEVINEHPVLLNRAPTLHRLGIQAFEPVLIEGKAIRLHPLVCTAFNADFDGDQMAVHVPLSTEAQMESRLLMLSSNNIFSPSNGRPIIAPSQDIVLGCYYLTVERESIAGGYLRTYADADEAITAYQCGEADIHSQCKLRIGNEIIETTIGRIRFNQIIPPGFGFINKTMAKAGLSGMIMDIFKRFGQVRTVSLLDDLKELGFEYATLAGVSIAMEDLCIPEGKKKTVNESIQEVSLVEKQYKKGFLTDGERYNKIIDIWTHTTDTIANMVFEGMDKFNSIFMMADSGARGSKLQIRQLAGMRGLMAKPSGEIIENPIIANFREGLTVLEFFISTHGARKGLADTALKTADAGYLTRRLVDVAQDVIISMDDCHTLNGITISAITEGDEVVVKLKERIPGRIALDNVVDIVTDKIIVAAGEEISEEKAKRIEELGIEKIRVRSVLTCQARHGVCIKCYGRNLANQRMAELGETVGILAAQSIGEPGTQLTMRTFHIGGTASRVVAQSSVKVKKTGKIKYHNLRTVVTKNNEIVVLNRNGRVIIENDIHREIESYNVPVGSKMEFSDHKKVQKGDVILNWDPYNSPILTEAAGKVRFEDIKEGLTMRKETDSSTGLTDMVIIDHKADYHPQIIICDAKNNVLAFYTIPFGAHIVVKHGSSVDAGALLAKIPRKITKTKDITGGLPRVAEIFEARKPKDPAIISEIDGIVDFGEPKKGQRRIIVTSASGMSTEYLIPPGKHLNVYKGDAVNSGQELTDGSVVPHHILKVSGVQKLQEHLVNEIQEVYRLQGVQINDKHIEVIVKQMLRKVKISEVGDTDLLPGEQVDKLVLEDVNNRIMQKKGKPAKGDPLLLGITKSSLSTESFISSASFQETTRVLTEAAAGGKRDELLGLKENVIMGHLIPAGTGFAAYRRIKVVHKEQQKEKVTNNS